MPAAPTEIAAAAAASTQQHCLNDAVQGITRAILPAVFKRCSSGVPAVFKTIDHDMSRAELLRNKRIRGGVSQPAAQALFEQIGREE